MIDDDKTSVCGRVVEFFNSRGIKEVQAARDMGVTRAAVSALCRGKTAPTINCLRYLRSLGADVNFILTGTGQQSDSPDELLRYVSNHWAALNTDDKIAISSIVQKAVKSGS